MHGMLSCMPTVDPSNLPDDVESLKALLLASHQSLIASQDQKAALQVEYQKLSKHTLALTQQLAVMEQQLAALRRARFGKSSEKLDANILQMELMIEDIESTIAELESDTEQSEPKTTTRKQRRQPLPESLPRETLTHDAGNCCQDCGHALALIGEDVSEQLEYTPASFRVIRHVRPKYRCDGCDTLVQ